MMARVNFPEEPNEGNFERVQKTLKIVAEKDFPELVNLVLRGEGGLLEHIRCDDADIEAFLQHVPIFNSIIRSVYDAVKIGSLESLKYFLDRERFCFAWDWDRPNLQGCLLHAAVKFDHLHIVQEICRVCPASISTSDVRGRTPLHYAALENKEDIYAFLITQGADPNQVDEFGSSAETYLTASQSNRSVSSSSTSFMISDSFHLSASTNSFRTDEGRPPADAKDAVSDDDELEIARCSYDEEPWLDDVADKSSELGDILEEEEEETEIESVILAPRKTDEKEVNDWQPVLGEDVNHFETSLSYALQKVASHPKEDPVEQLAQCLIVLGIRNMRIEQSENLVNDESIMG